MRIIFTLLITLVLLPLYGTAETGDPIYNADDVAVLKKIAQDNYNFIHRIDWLSENPDWIGVVWEAGVEDSRVVQMNLDQSYITQLDVRELSELKDLSYSNVSWGANSSLSELKVSGLNKLENLKIKGHYLKELDCSGLSNLKFFDFSSCDFESFSSVGLLNLEVLCATYNNLKEIDISNSSKLIEIDVSNNHLPFSQLLPLLAIESNDISSQAYALPIKSSGLIDFSKEALFNGHSTIFKWFHSYGVEVDDSKVESVDLGMFQFNLAGQFYCEMTNSLFQDLTLRTNDVTIKSGNNNEDDVSALRNIAENNTEFIYRDDWLSDSPEWEGVVWEGSMVDARVVEMSFDDSKLANVDLRPLSELRIFKASSWATDPQISSLNITGLSKLKELNYHRNSISDIDFTGVTSLEKLNCSGNDLKSLDVSLLPNLTYLNCGANYLTEVDISNLPNLVELVCYFNELSFKALYPLMNIERIDYQNQKYLFEELKSTGLIDYSDEVDVDGTATEFKWFYSMGTELEVEHVETKSPGVFAFKIAGEFYCEMTNALFPGKILKSKTVTIIGTGKNADDINTLKKIAEANPNFIYREDWLSETPEWKGVTWGGSLDDSRVISLVLKKAQLSILDVSALAELQELNCSGYSNSYSSSDVSVSSLKVEGLQKLQKLKCDYNDIIELNLSDLPKLEILNCYANNIKTLDLSLLPDLKEVDCYFNDLTQIEIAENSSLTTFDCRYNNLKFSTLFPFREIHYFQYSDQERVFEIDAVEGLVDYSSEAVIGDVSSQYKWYKNDGDLLDVSDFEVVEPGKFKFNIAGDFYCEITNSHFSDLKLVTNKVTVEPSQINVGEVAALRKIAEDNPNFIYHDDWLSDNPEWKGVVWGGNLTDGRVIKMTLDDSNLSSLDLRPFTELLIFKASSWATDPQISSLNITGLLKLKELDYRYNTISDIDFTGVTSLEKLNCSSNDLQNLDLSKLPKLTTLYCERNNLKQLDISNNPNLANLYCYSNKLNFQALYSLINVVNLSYKDQKTLFEEIETTGVVDYSDEIEVNGTATNFKWFSSTGVELLPEQVETTSAGVFTFKIAGEFYCEMTNALFPNFSLKTSNVTTVSSNKNSDDVNTLKKIAEANPKFIYREDWLSESPEWKGVMWGGSLDDSRVTSLVLNSSQLSILDVSNLADLRELDCSWRSNSHSSFDVHISSLIVAGLQKLQKIDCNENIIIELNLNNLPALETLYCYDNSLNSIDLSELPTIRILDCRNNYLKQLDITKNPNLVDLSCSSNKFNFKALYSLINVEYLGSLNQKLLFEEIESTGIVDYSDEVDVNGTAINFKWFSSTGVELLPEQVETTSAGVFTFKIAGQFYCEMTNALFPDLILKTSNVTTVSTSKNTDDINSLKKIAEANPQFIYREDWLGESPEWAGVTWGGKLDDSRVISLVLNRSQLSVLDVSSLADLRDLDCSWNSNNYSSADINISTLIVAGLQKLQKIDCDNANILELNLTDLPELEILDCHYNAIKTLDLSLLPKLNEVNCYYNNLTQIEIAENSSLITLDCRYNNLKFSTLLPVREIHYFQYSDQKRVFEIDTVEGLVDYSSEAVIGDVSSQYKWYKNDGDLLDVSDFEVVEPGKFKFNIAGDFYCEITNSHFSDLKLVTNTITVVPSQENADDIAVLRKIAEDNPNFIYRSDWLSETPEWKGVTWGGKLDDAKVDKLVLESCKLDTLDVSNLKELTSLYCSYNRTLASLNVRGLDKLINLRYQSDKLEDVSLEGLVGLEYLECADNEIETIDLSEVTNLTYLGCGSNKLKQLDISSLSHLERIRVYGNFFRFSVQKSFFEIEEFYPSYQNEIMDEIESTGLVDYSTEAVIDGTPTSFKWYNSFGSEVKDEHLEEIEPGVFKFKIAGKFYCEMTNALFPNMTLKTNLVTITEGVNPYALNQHWTRAKNFRGGARKGAVGFVIGNYGYLAMGENEGLLKDFWRYDPNDDYWHKLTDCPMDARKDAIGFSINRKGYIGLGTNGTEKFVDFWQYNPDDSSWTHITDYPGENSQLVSWVIHNDKVYFFCGRDVSGKYSREVWEYDPETNKWTQKKDFPGDTRIFAFAYSINNKVYLGNGQNYENGSMMTNDLWEYVPETDEWTENDMILGYTSTSPSYFTIEDKGYYGLSGFSGSKFYQLDPEKEDWSKSIFPYVDIEKNLNDPVIFVIKDKAYLCTGSLNNGIFEETIGAEVIVFDPPAVPVVAPQNLVAELVDDFKVKLTWDDMSESELSQEVLYSTDGDNFESLSNVYSNREYYTTDDLDPNTTYYFKVKVVGEYDDFQLSEIVSITTKIEPIFVPTNLNLEVVDYLKIRLNWEDNSRAEESQEVLMSLDNENWTVISMTVDVETYLTQKLEPETEYFFKVKIIGFDSEELLTEVVSITTDVNPLFPVEDLKAIVLNSLTVKLEWKDNSLVEVIQEILFSKDDVNYDKYDEVSADIESFVSKDLESATTYFFKIKNIDSDDNSCLSEAVEVTTDKVTGIDDVFEENLQIYPNPATDFVILKMSGSEMKRISLLDAKGNVIRIKEAKTELKLGLNGLASGNYFINIASDVFSVTKRIVILNK